MNTSTSSEFEVLQPLKKESLRSKAEKELLRLIISSRLKPGSALSSVELARQLGISRTPVREALQRLEQDGFLSCDHQGVFRIPPLTAEEARSIYELRAELEPLALRWAGCPEPEVLDRLASANEHIRLADTPSEFIRRDEAWHRQLLQHCPNKILIDYIEHLHNMSWRFEFAYLSDTRNSDLSAVHHQSIVSALRKENLDAACQQLAENLRVSLPGVLGWLQDDE